MSNETASPRYHVQRLRRNGPPKSYGEFHSVEAAHRQVQVVRDAVDERGRPRHPWAEFVVEEVVRP